MRADLIYDFVTKFRLSEKVDNNFLEELARTNLKSNKFHEAALIIHKFKFQNIFDIPFLLTKLVDSNRIPVAK